MPIRILNIIHTPIAGLDTKVAKDFAERYSFRICSPNYGRVTLDSEDSEVYSI